MDRAKIDAAVKVMQQLTPEERGAVNYTVEREGRKRVRGPNKPKIELQQTLGDATQ